MDLHEHFRLVDSPLSHMFGSPDPGKDTAVIFVHGLYGDALKSWGVFPTLVNQLKGQYSWWRSCDLYFYGYKTNEGQLQMFADQLADFLQTIFPCPRVTLRIESEGRTESDELSHVLPPRQYRRLILAGHSLGGVAIRYMMRDMAIECEQSSEVLRPARVSILESASLKLFAPALFGLRVPGLLGYLWNRGGLAELLARALQKDTFQLTRDLETKDIERVQRESEDLFRRLPNFRGLVATSLWGSKEEYLKISRYACDYPNQYAAGHSHASVCKPSRMYHEPLTFVRYDSGTVSKTTAR